jgi:TPR repeat protein
MNGILPKLGYATTIAEMNEAVGELLSLDVLRIRREWRTHRPARPRTASTRADYFHLRAHERWASGRHLSAFRLMLAAAKLGDSSAMVNLGYCYDVGIGIKKNRDESIKSYTKAYRLGHAAGANNIGTIYRYENKAKRTFRWFSKAASLGDIDANLQIARICIEDLATPASAIPYLRRVARGMPRAEVTESSREEALLLLNGLKPRSGKRSSKA